MTRSTVAARCAAMSTAVAQIILDASSFARQMRDARHYVNAINADLLAIKLSLDIACDDFSAANNIISALSVEAMTGFLDCCVTFTESLHKPIIRLSVLVGEKRKETWQLFSEEALQGIQQNLEALRSALDLVSDLLALTHADSNESNDSYSGLSIKKSRIDGRSPSPGNSILRRIDIEREQIEVLTEGRVPELYTHLDQLRTAAKFFSEEKEAVEEIHRRTDSRSDSLEPRSGDQSRSARDASPLFSSTSQSPAPSSSSSPSPVSSGGIGAWISNVISQKLLSHRLPPDAFTLSDPRAATPDSARARSREQPDRQGDVPSRLTFYAESTTSESQTQSSRKTPGIESIFHARIDSAYIKDVPNPKANRLTTLTQYTNTTECSTIYDQNITDDKIAIAKGYRKQLSKNQRLTVDRKLRDISTNITPVHVERIFFEGAIPNVPHPEFGTLVIRAAYEMPTDVLKLLVDYGADITKTSQTPYYSTLHAAVLGKQLENLQYLFSLATTDPSSAAFPTPPTPTFTRRPLSTFPSSIIFSVDVPNANGETPLHIASRTPGSHHIAKWLLDMGADVNMESPLGGTPLQLAVSKLDSRERSAMVELLMAHGADGEVIGESAGMGCERRGKGLSVLGLI